MGNYDFFQNKDCPYFPCHKMDEEKFNCLFCYCPLYMLKDDCGGNFMYLDSGIKDCSNCTLPHIKGVGYHHVMSKMDLVLGRTQKKED